MDLNDFTREQLDAHEHPSRAAPKCVDCQHSTMQGYCGHPAMPVSLVDGRPMTSLRAARAAVEGVALRQASRHQLVICGPAGKLFSRPGDAAPKVGK